MVKMGANFVQNPATVGYIFGICMSLLIVIVGSVLIHKYGHKGNDAFKYAPGPSQRWALPVLIWRVVVFLFSFVTLVGFTFQGDAAYPGQSRAWGLSYFTVWNWMLLNVYFAVGVAVSVVRTFMPERVPRLVGDASAKTVEPAPTRTLKTLFTAHHLIGEVEVPASLFVALVVWCYLVLTSAGGNRHEISGLSKSSRRGTKFCLSRRCGILFCHAHLMRSRVQVAGDARTSFART